MGAHEAGPGRMPGIRGACVYASSPCGLLGELYATPQTGRPTYSCNQVPDEAATARCRSVAWTGTARLPHEDRDRQADAPASTRDSAIASRSLHRVYPRDGRHIRLAVAELVV